jgi:hypothetical protein
MRNPPTREQLIAYIRKLESRVRFLEARLKQHKESAPQRAPLSSVFMPEKGRGLRLGVEQSALETTVSEPAAECAPDAMVHPGVGLASPPRPPQKACVTETPPNTHVPNAALYPHPLNDPLVLAVPDILPPAFVPGQFTKMVLEGEEEEVVEPLMRGLSELRRRAPDENRKILLRMTSAYWTAVTRMGRRIGAKELSWPKRLFMRFGILDPELLTRKVWQILYNENSPIDGTGVYYLDEWLEAVYTKEIHYSLIDEMVLGGGKAKKDASNMECLLYELMNIHQMQRLAVGPRANLITILTSDYCMPSRDNPLLLREWVFKTYKSLLPFDYRMFSRKYKGEDIEVRPLWLILPGYGTRGACWEPWSPGNKRSGPRLLVCLFPPRCSYRCLVDALSDCRWTYAKEDAMHYWMTEGLTGKFLAMFSNKEHREDMKALFRKLYLQWMLNEPRRIPRLDRRMREFYYYNCTYSDEVKKTLRYGSLFSHMIELEMAKREREDGEREGSKRVKAMREVRRGMRQTELEAG